MAEKYVMIGSIILLLLTMCFATAALAGGDRSHSDYYPSTLWRSGEWLSGDETAPDKHWRGRPPYQYDRWYYVDEPYLIDRWYTPYYEPYYYYPYKWKRRQLRRQRRWERRQWRQERRYWRRYWW